MNNVLNAVVSYLDLLLKKLPKNSSLRKSIKTIQKSGQKAIITSGYSETERVREVQRFGAGAYIKKPYTLEKIGLAVKTELSK